MSDHERVVRCWESRWDVEGGWEETDDETCLLRDGHDGPHEWTPDSEILVKLEGDL